MEGDETTLDALLSELVRLVLCIAWRHGTVRARCLARGVLAYQPRGTRRSARSPCSVRPDLRQRLASCTLTCRLRAHRLRRRSPCRRAATTQRGTARCTLIHRHRCGWCNPGALWHLCARVRRPLRLCCGSLLCARTAGDTFIGPSTSGGRRARCARGARARGCGPPRPCVRVARAAAAMSGRRRAVAGGRVCVWRTCPRRRVAPVAACESFWRGVRTEWRPWRPREPAGCPRGAARASARGGQLARVGARASSWSAVVVRCSASCACALLRVYVRVVVVVVRAWRRRALLCVVWLWGVAVRVRVGCRGVASARSRVAGLVTCLHRSRPFRSDARWDLCPCHATGHVGCDTQGILTLLSLR